LACGGRFHHEVGFPDFGFPFPVPIEEWFYGGEICRMLGFVRFHEIRRRVEEVFHGDADIDIFELFRRKEFWLFDVTRFGTLDDIFLLFLLFF
jgi:hypothetical protein